ncbi:MAG: ClpXP protease specificity-enhancing factor SspB [Alphaproteobacteria bacterium]
MSDWLKERYLEEMTIVVQHQYWGLASGRWTPSTSR